MEIKHNFNKKHTTALVFVKQTLDMSDMPMVDMGDVFDNVLKDIKTAPTTYSYNSYGGSCYKNDATVYFYYDSLMCKSSKTIYTKLALKGYLEEIGVEFTNEDEAIYDSCDTVCYMCVYPNDNKLLIKNQYYSFKDTLESAYKELGTTLEEATAKYKHEHPDEFNSYGGYINKNVISYPTLYFYEWSVMECGAKSFYGEVSLKEFLNKSGIKFTDEDISNYKNMSGCCYGACHPTDNYFMLASSYYTLKEKLAEEWKKLGSTIDAETEKVRARIKY